MSTVREVTVRTDPNFLPVFRPFHPVRMRIIVDGADDPMVLATVTLQEIPGRFYWPFGPASTTVACRKVPRAALHELIGEVIIWPRGSGRAKLHISSPDSTFKEKTIWARGTPAPVASLQTVDNQSNVTQMTYLFRRFKRLATKAGAVLGTFAALFWATHEDKNQVAEEATEAEIIEQVEVPQAPIEVPAPQADPKPELVALIPPRMDCIFLDPNREQDVNGQVHVKCDNRTYQATATYKGEGRFEYTNLVPSP